MKKAEITRRFDEIIAFAEVEPFVDTPVKHYSSGMYVRLAFAVAAHLDSEILFVDEVLAVGDFDFQKKCVSKMEEAGKKGQTVLFVSHNLLTITRLCGRAILLDSGCLRRDGAAAEVVGYYARDALNAPGAREWTDPATAPSGDVARLRAVRLRSEEGKLVDSIDIRRPLGVEIEFDVLKPGYKLLPNFRVDMADGVRAFSSYDLDPSWRGRGRPLGRYVTTAWIPGNLLTEGPMFISVGMVAVDPTVRQFYEANAVAFQVVDTVAGDGARGDYHDNITGAVRPLLNWTTRWNGDSRSSDAAS
jgi:lipopolysaccharide transport system ATP-binding protein